MQHFSNLKDYILTRVPDGGISGADATFTVELPHGMRMDVRLDMRERRTDIELNRFERGGAIIGASHAGDRLSIAGQVFENVEKPSYDVVVVHFPFESHENMFNFVRVLLDAAMESVPVAALIRAIGAKIEARAMPDCKVSVSFFKVDISSDTRAKTRIEYSAASRTVEIRAYHEISQLGRVGPPAGYFTASRDADADILARVALSLHAMALDVGGVD